MADSKVRVAVRVRPMNQREIGEQAECVILIEGTRTVLKSTSRTYDGSCTAQKEFVFDDCFWSVNDDGPAKYTSQEDIFKTLGEDIIDNIFTGFNTCIFAYGQTGSGKTFSMMGTDDQPGLVPRICSALFSREINHLQSLQVEAAYLEIYNEKVRDLLHPTSDNKALNIREHKSFGPYVEGLSHHAVRNTEDIKSLILQGNKCRKIASTKMNEHSSRSHAIFTLTVTQTLQNEQGVRKELLSKVSLVDLAGSERTSKSGATGDRMIESNNINKSLTSLGLVINSLAELSEDRRSNYINYRDSTLTWLLKNNLGGNSKTVMLATISPASVHYPETLSTLKYADSAKRIVNRAMVNEDIKAKAITELKEEVTRLREQLQQAKAKYKQDLEAKLYESEKLLRELKVPWEEKLKTTEASALVRQRQLQRLGITVEDTDIGVDADKCYLINLSIGNSNQNNLLLYHLGERTKIGAGDSQDIQVTGPGMELEHCVIDILQDGKVFLKSNKKAETFVNSLRVQTGVMLSHEDKIQLGSKVTFMLHKPDTKPDITQEGADVNHNVPSIQPEERHRQDDETVHEESDASIGSDNAQCSYRESSDCPVMWTSADDAGSLDSSGQNWDIPQNRPIVSPDINDTKHLEDRDSCERKIPTIETIISPKKHKKKEGNSEVNLISENKKSNEDDTTDNDKDDDTSDISINLARSMEGNQEISSSKNHPDKFDTSKRYTSCCADMKTSVGIFFWDNITDISSLTYQLFSTFDSGLVRTAIRDQESDWRSVERFSPVIIIFPSQTSAAPGSPPRRFLDFCVRTHEPEDVIIVITDLEDTESEERTIAEWRGLYDRCPLLTLTEDEMDVICTSDRADVSVERRMAKKMRQMMEILQGGAGSSQHAHQRLWKLREPVIRIFSRGAESQYSWLEKALRSDISGDNIPEVRPGHIRNGVQQFFNNMFNCTYGILYHSRNTGKPNETDVSDALYDEELRRLSTRLGKEKVIVVIDDQEDSGDDQKTQILNNQPSIREMAQDLFLISEKEKTSNYQRRLRVDREELEKKLQRMRDTIRRRKTGAAGGNRKDSGDEDETGEEADETLSEEDTRRRSTEKKLNDIRQILTGTPRLWAPGTFWPTWVMLHPQKVGIFSRSAESEYQWLKTKLESFMNIVRVQSYRISNTGFQQFTQEVSSCAYGILYHSKNRGRINVTDVTGSLYDQELQYMYETLGRDRVIVIIDDLSDDSNQAKERILENQPSIKNLAKNLFLFTSGEHQE